MNLRLRPTMVASVTLLLLPALAFGCINDSDTLEDELQSRAPVFQVITGQIAQHGPAYYERRLESTRDLLARAPDSLEGLYDAAGAHMRLGGHDAAIDYLQRADALAPERYKTHSNLGVAYLLKAESRTDKQARHENLTAALDHTERALARRPGAHFGAGWLFSRMVAWKRTTLEGGVPKRTMMGGSYEDLRGSSVIDAAEVRAEKLGTLIEREFDPIDQLLTLLRGHPHLAEGYLVLGMNLHTQRNHHLALWSYVRALELGHPCKDAIHKHIDAIFTTWKGLVAKRRNARHLRLMTKADTLARIRSELKAADRWLVAFQKTEEELLAASDALPDLRTVMRALERRGIKRRARMFAGLIDERWRRKAQSQATGTAPGALPSQPDSATPRGMPQPSYGAHESAIASVAGTGAKQPPMTVLWLAGALLCGGLGLATLTRGRRTYASRRGHRSRRYSRPGGRRRYR